MTYRSQTWSCSRDNVTNITLLCSLQNGSTKRPQVVLCEPWSDPKRPPTWSIFWLAPTTQRHVTQSSEVHEHIRSDEASHFSQSQKILLLLFEKNGCADLHSIHIYICCYFDKLWPDMISFFLLTIIPVSEKIISLGM